MLISSRMDKCQAHPCPALNHMLRRKYPVVKDEEPEHYIEQAEAYHNKPHNSPAAESNLKPAVQ